MMNVLRKIVYELCSRVNFITCIRPAEWQGILFSIRFSNRSNTLGTNYTTQRWRTTAVKFLATSGMKFCAKLIIREAHETIHKPFLRDHMNSSLWKHLKYTYFWKTLCLVVTPCCSLSFANSKLYIQVWVWIPSHGKNKSQY